MKYNKILMIMIVLFLSSCASTKNNQQAELRKLIIAGENQKALEYIENDNFLSDKNSELLKLIERGRVYFINKQYYQALQNFDNAKELSDQLFTVSISKKH